MLKGEMETQPEQITISISGTKFEIELDLLLKLPDTRLGKMATMLKMAQAVKNSDSPEIGSIVSYSRPLSMFEAVLAYYQTGQLHIPSHVCPKAFRLELDFWEIDSNELENCCLYKYLSAMTDFETMDQFRESLPENQSSTQLSGISTLQSVKQRLWSIIDNRETSIYAKIYLVLSILFMLISIFSLALSTLPSAKIPLSNCELANYLESIEDNYDGFWMDFLKSVPCGSEIEQMILDYGNSLNEDYYNYDLNMTEATYSESDTVPSGGTDDTARSKAPIMNMKLPSQSKVHPVFIFLEYVSLAFFTFELILRLLTCPNLKGYFRNLLNDIEILILLGAYIKIIIDETSSRYRYEEKGLVILQYLQMFRVLRVFRVMSNVTAMRVLSHALKSGFTDLIVLVMYLFVGIMLFSNFLYFVEDSANIPSIPEAWWWGIITMTTVGYGDVVPHTVIGRIIGSICALSGVVLLSLVIPVFVNTFMSLYQFANLHKKHKNLLTKLNKNKNASVASLKAWSKVAPMEIKDEEKLSKTNQKI